MSQIALVGNSSLPIVPRKSFFEQVLEAFPGAVVLDDLPSSENPAGCSPHFQVRGGGSSLTGRGRPEASCWPERGEVVPSVVLSNLPRNNGFYQEDDAPLSAQAVASLFSAPADAPLYIMGCQNTSPSEAGLKTTPKSTAACEPTPRVAPSPSLPGGSVAPCGPVSGLLVDYLNFTYPVHTDALLDGLKLLLGDDWQEMEKPFYGYRAGARCGNIMLLWAGAVEGMGVHVQLSGQGCRELEGRHAAAGVGDLDWRTWLGHRLKEGAKFTQTHLAFDDLGGVISVDKITDAFKAGQCVTRFSTFKPEETFGQSRERTSHGFYFGKRSQNTSICVYDKKLEQEQKDKGKEIDVEAYERKVKALENGWTRLELRNRNERSQALVLAIVEDGWGVVAGFLRGYLDIRTPSADTNRSRWEVALWWEQFCGWADKARLKVAAVEKTMQSAMAWLDKQVGTMLAMLETVLPDAPGFLAGVAARGAKRFGKRHLNMMSAYLRIGEAAVPSASLGLAP